MKVVIHSRPRAGTKNLQMNFQNYLLTLDLPVLGRNSKDGIGEPLELRLLSWDVSKTTQRMVGWNELNGVVWEETDKEVELETEVRSRFTKLLSWEGSWVLKRQPWWPYDPILFETQAFVDKPIVVKRDDIFEQCLSVCLGRKTNVFHPGSELDDVVKKAKKNPITIDINEFKYYYEVLKHYNNIPWPSTFQVVDFWEMIKIKTDKEFCDFFNLEYKQFEFIPFEIEYGNDKEQIIKNIYQCKVAAGFVEGMFRKNIKPYFPWKILKWKEWDFERYRKEL